MYAHSADYLNYLSRLPHCSQTSSHQSDAYYLLRQSLCGRRYTKKRLNLQSESGPLLVLWQHTSRLRLETDAAQSTGLGMALWQEHIGSNGTSCRLLQSTSQSTSEADTRFSATEIELLAVVWVCKKASLFPSGNDLEVVVNHRPLIPSKTLGELSSPRIICTRLKEKLAPFNLTAVWSAGVSRKTFDCLSRHPVDSPEDADLYGESELDTCLRVFKQIANLVIDTGRDHVADQHIIP